MCSIDSISRFFSVIGKESRPGPPRHHALLNRAAPVCAVHLWPGTRIRFNGRVLAWMVSDGLQPSRELWKAWMVELLVTSVGQPSQAW